MDIEHKLEKEHDDPVDDSNADPDYRDSDASGESSEEDEEEACTSTPAVTGWRSRERPKEHLLVYVDPPVECADGDTDMDSGNFLNYKVRKKCPNFCNLFCGVVDPDLYCLMFLCLQDPDSESGSGSRVKSGSLDPDPDSNLDPDPNPDQK